MDGKQAETDSVGNSTVEARGDPTNEAEAGEMTVSPRRAALRAYGVEIVFASALGLYAILAVLAHRYAYFAWDLALARAIQSVRLPGFHTLMIWISVLGDGWVPVGLVFLTSVALILAGFRLEGIISISGVGAGGALNRLLKSLSARPRPSEALVQVATDYRHESFPSGHVVFFVEFFGFLLLLTYILLKPGRSRRIAISLLGALILMIGISRVHLGAHWPSDVVGAYLAGGLWLILMVEIYRRLKARESSK